MYVDINVMNIIEKSFSDVGKLLVIGSLWTWNIEVPYSDIVNGIQNF